MRIIHLCVFNEANRIFAICTSSVIPLACEQQTHFRSSLLSRRPEMRMLFAGCNTPCLLPKVLLACVHLLGTTEISGEFKNKGCAKFIFGGGGVGGNRSMLTKIRKIIEKR